MSRFRDLFAEFDVTMVPLPRFQREASAQMPLGGYPDAPSGDGWRRRHFWCPLKKLEVEVEFATRSFLGLPRTVGVKECTAFDQPRDVACGRHCLDSRFRRQWPAALPVMDRGAVSRSSRALS